ncbi:MAG: head maturation protease, ClpP-related [Marinifilaceae bacterium]
MSNFLNVIPGTERYCILIYGSIGEFCNDVNAESIMRELQVIENLELPIDVRINSIGGDVFAGIAILNALKNSKADITIYIDGVAASIASIISQCGKPLHMSKYARMMIHSVQVGAYGDKRELSAKIDVINSLENTLAVILSEKSGKSVDDIITTYFDGADHWLSAPEALREGFIDAIYDVDPVPDNATPEEILNIFQNRLKESQNQEEMDFTQLRSRPTFANCANDTDYLNAIVDIDERASKVPALEAENTELKNKLNEHEGNRRKLVIDNAIAQGKITEGEREVYDNLLKSDFTNASQALNLMKPKKSIKDVIENKGAGDMCGMSWDELDRKGLLATLKNNYPTVYEAKFKEKFNK